MFEPSLNLSNCWKAPKADRYSVAEIAVYSECPVPWPADLPRAHGIPVDESIDAKVLVFGILAGIFVLVHRRKGPNLQYVLLMPVLGALWMLIADLVDLYPFFNQEPPLRALVAGLAALVQPVNVTECQ